MLLLEEGEQRQLTLVHRGKDLRTPGKEKSSE
jgi:hypothetical protein